MFRDASVKSHRIGWVVKTVCFHVSKSYPTPVPNCSKSTRLGLIKKLENRAFVLGVACPPAPGLGDLGVWGSPQLRAASHPSPKLKGCCPDCGIPRDAPPGWVASPVRCGNDPSFQWVGFGRTVLGAVLERRWWSRASWWVPSCRREGGLLTLSPPLLLQGGCRPSCPLQPGRTEQEEVLRL